MHELHFVVRRRCNLPRRLSVAAAIAAYRGTSEAGSHVRWLPNPFLIHGPDRPAPPGFRVFKLERPRALAHAPGPPLRRTDRYRSWPRWNGKIIEHWADMDFLGFLRALGAPGRDCCGTGARVPSTSLAIGRVGTLAPFGRAAVLNGEAGKTLSRRQRGGRVLPSQRSARRGRTRSSARCCAGTQRCF
jgi:hypothetical protein